MDKFEMIVHILRVWRGKRYHGIKQLESLQMRIDSRLRAINFPLSVERTHLEETVWAVGDPTNL